MSRGRLAFGALLAVTAALLACASFDTTPGLASVTSDAGEPPEAGASEASTPPFCSTVDASLCWSFDGDSTGFTSPGFDTVIQNGDLSYSTDHPRSPPRALDVSLDVLDAGLTAIHHYQAKAGSHVICSFDARVDVIGASSVVIAQLSDPAWVGLGRIVVTPDLHFELEKTQSAGSVEKPIGTYPPNTWVHVSLEVDAPNRVLVGSVEGATSTSPLDDDGGAPPTITDLHMGLGAFDLPTFWRVSFDDLYCTGF